MFILAQSTQLKIAHKNPHTAGAVLKGYFSTLLPAGSVGDSVAAASNRDCESCRHRLRWRVVSEFAARTTPPPTQRRLLKSQPTYPISKTGMDTHNSMSPKW